MKQSAASLFFILILAMQAFGQDVVNANKKLHFNGTWIFDTKKTDLRSKDLYKGETLEISYKEPELKIVKTLTIGNETKSATLILFTDNRGEKNRPYPFNQRLEVTSNTGWDKDSLIRTYTTKFYKSGKVVGGATTKETYAISEDGNALTIIDESDVKITSDSPYGELKTDQKGKIKLVYKRKM